MTKRNQHPAHTNGTRWKNLSQRLRAQQPFCDQCGATDNLTVDHIVRFIDRPEWAYEEANLRVLCREHNEERSNTPAPAHIEAHIAQIIANRGTNPHPLPSPAPAWYPKSQLQSTMRNREA